MLKKNTHHKQYISDAKIVLRPWCISRAYKDLNLEQKDYESRVRHFFLNKYFAIEKWAWRVAIKMYWFLIAHGIVERVYFILSSTA